MPIRAGSIAVAGLMLVIGTACQSSGTPPAATSGASLAINVPSPLTGPGREVIESTERKSVSEGWADLLAGRFEDATASVARFSSAQADLLRLQVNLTEGPTTEVLEQLKALVDEHSQYASGWATLSTAAESMGNESLALKAARQNTRLWPSGPFAGKTADLENRWITARLDRGREALVAEQPMQALSAVEHVLDLEPENQSGLLVRAQALVQLQQGPEAEAALSRLGSLPEALVLRAEMASAQGRWQHAMDLLSGLPDGYPEKDKELRRARLMWRISILPPHVREAVESESVTREQLAVILVAMVPSLGVEPGGTTPLMTDIIDLPSQRAILAVARLEIIPVDRAAMRFHPQRVATLNEIRTAVESVSHLAGFTSPLWCEGGMNQSGTCVLIEDPVKGMVLVNILLSMNMKAAI